MAASSFTFLQEFISEGRHNRPGNKIVPTSVTIHNTDNPNSGAGAKAHSAFVRNTGFYLLKGKKHWVSWHFTVDDTFAIQHVPTNEVAYHAGSAANGSSIAVEICMNADGDEATANNNAAALVATILKTHGLTVSDIKKHKDWTGKNCPSRLMTAMKWKAFIARVTSEMANPSATIDLKTPELESLETPDARDRNIPDFEIDHHKLQIEVEGAARALVPEADVGHGSAMRGADALRSVMTTLSEAQATGVPTLFPYGINDIELTISATEFKVTVKGPDKAAASIVEDGQLIADDTVPDDGLDMVAEAVPPAVDTHLEDSTVVYGTNSTERRWGVARTIAAIEKVATQFHSEFGVRIGVGDISKKNGGAISGHASHRKGVDADIRIPRKDGKELGSNYKDASYSRERTQRLVDLFRQSDFPVTHIFFNDPKVHGVSKWPNHDNHLHVRFDINAA